MKTWIAFSILMGIVIAGCTDAKFASITSLGSSASVTCYSGGKAVYEGTSTGRVATTEHSDGWEFKDAKTGKFVRVSGDCVVVN